MTDNFSSGKTGNLLGCVNLKTGLVEGVTGGTGFEITGYHDHPDTGRPLVGITLPYWEEMINAMPESGCCATGAASCSIGT